MTFDIFNLKKAKLNLHCKNKHFLLSFFLTGLFPYKAV